MPVGIGITRKSRAGGVRFYLSTDPYFCLPALSCVLRCRRAKEEYGLKLSLHCGETMAVREQEAMLDLLPDRLGHMCVMSHTTMQRLLEPLRAERAAAAAAAASAGGKDTAGGSNIGGAGASAAAATEGSSACACGSSSSSSGAASPHPRPWIPSSSVPLPRTIPIEVCPTSNSLTLSLPGLRHHPTLAPWLQLGYPFAVCTDDSTVFGVTLSSEYATVAREFGLSRGAVAELAQRAFDFAFLPEEQKAVMKAAAAEQVRALLAADHDGPVEKE